MKKHVAVFTPSVVQQIFSGKKTIETRFSKNRIPPFGEVSVGDLVYIKPSGKDITGQFYVKKVISFENLDASDWKLIREAYGSSLSLGTNESDDLYFSTKKSARYGTIIFIDRLEQFITSPIRYRKSDGRGWVVLEKEN